MKVTLEIPDELLRQAKALAAEHRQSLKDFVEGAVRDKLLVTSQVVDADGPEQWLQGFGKLKHLHTETIRIQSIIDQEFETL